MNFCPNCGAKIISRASFCSNCGLDLRKKAILDTFEIEKSEWPQTTKKVIDSPIEKLKTGQVNVTTSTNVNTSENQETDSKVTSENNNGLQKTEPENTVATSKRTKGRVLGPEQINAVLKAQLETLYKKMTMIFGIHPNEGRLSDKFSKIRLKISKKIEGYDLDEISNRVIPLCSDDYVGTKEDIDYVIKLIQKYENFTRRSCLEQQLGYLSGQSSTAIVDAENLNSLQEYMHINRGSLERDFLKLIEGLGSSHGKVIFLVGNVGDGKSHLIGYLKEKHPDLFDQKHVHIHYDATESLDPKKTAMETLFNILTPFTDGKIDNNYENWVIAINMGVLMNFRRQAQKDGEFTRVIDFLETTGIMTSTTVKEHLDDLNFSLISFRDYPLFQVDETGTSSAFYDELFSKVVDKNPNNPFFVAYQDDQEHYVTKLTHHNFELFSNYQVRETLKFLLIKIQIESKVIISTRALLELVHDILVPVRLEENKVITYRNSLPYLLFGGTGDSVIIKQINKFDPQGFQNHEVDKLMTKVYNSQKDICELMTDFLGQKDADTINWLWKYISLQDMDKKFAQKVALLIRMKYLLNRNATIFDDQVYFDYLKIITILDNDTEVMSNNFVREFYKTVKKFIYNWNGSPESNYIFTFINNKEKIGVAVPFSMMFKGIWEQDLNIILRLSNSNATKEYSLVIDFDLFKLIYAVNQGYMLKMTDRHQFANVSTFIENITESNQTLKETLIGSVETNQFYRLTYDGMDVEMRGENVDE